MGNNGGMRAAQRRVALWATLAAIVLVPLAAPSAAAAPEASVSMASEAAALGSDRVEQPVTDEAYRAAGIMVAATAVIGLLAALWWYLVIRRRD